jgi:hypothetical protein
MNRPHPQDGPRSGSVETVRWKVDLDTEHRDGERPAITDHLYRQAGASGHQTDDASRATNSGGPHASATHLVTQRSAFLIASGS